MNCQDYFSICPGAAGETFGEVLSSSSHQPGILAANQQGWLPGSVEELLCEELLTPSHEVAVRFLMENSPVQWKHVPGCAASVQQMQCVFCEMSSIPQICTF